MSSGQVEVTVEKLVYGGAGLSRDGGRVLLTPFVLPGERARVEPVDKLNARLVELIEASAERAAPPCPYFFACGGCHYQHARYASQLDYKREILREVLRRVGKIDVPGEISTIAGCEWNYRNRTQLHVRDGQIGYLRMGSHELCPVDRCPISSPRLNEAMAVLARMAGDGRFPGFVRTVELFTNEDQVQFNVLSTDKPLARHFFDWCAGEIPGYAPGAIDYPVGERRFRVGPRSFFQVNRHLAGALVEAAIGDASGESALELYAGVGLFSAALAERFPQLTAVESGASAVSDLKANVPSVRVIRGDAAEYLTGIEERVDFVLADPPRDGMGKSTVRELIRIRPRRLHIVACDPATLARDLRPLVDAGYRLELVVLVDLFPQTYHLETVVHLSFG